MLRTLTAATAISLATMVSAQDTAKPATPKQDTPKQVVESFLRAEMAIAQLQTAQMKYNLEISLDEPGASEPLSLAAGIKVIGGLARAEKMYRSAAAPKEDRYGSYNEDVRDAGQERAKPTITVQEAVTLAVAVSKTVGALRAAIAVANATELELDLDPALFE